MNVMSPPKTSNLLMPFSIFLFLLGLSNLSLSSATCNEDDKNVLLQIKTHFGNPNSLSSWSSGDCSYWAGIGTNDLGRVTLIRITNHADIRGPIPTFLDQLPFLSTLDFYQLPNLSGPIPWSIGNLSNLLSLSISGTSVNGPIPDSLGQLASLAHLDLRSNRLSGSIPSVLAQLSHLEYLALNSNNFSGPIPDFLGKILKSLNYIGLEFNSFSGPIPASLGLLPNLTTIHFSGNKITGPIPDPLGPLDKLSSVHLSNNLITGDVTYVFDRKYRDLKFVYVDNNMLKFNFSNVKLARTLDIINISHNMIYGSLPLRIGLMKPDPNHLDVSYNELCGPIPFGFRFRHSDPAMFDHNKCLCGGPLHPCKFEINNKLVGWSM